MHIEEGDFWCDCIGKSTANMKYVVLNANTINKMACALIAICTTDDLLNRHPEPDTHPVYDRL
jgi:hypothetical protein